LGCRKKGELVHTKGRFAFGSEGKNAYETWKPRRVPLNFKGGRESLGEARRL